MNLETTRRIKRKLWQECYELLISSLVAVAGDGQEIPGPDNYSYRVHPILCSFICDYPEGVLACCIKGGLCARCECSKSQLSTIVYPQAHLRPPVRKTLDMISLFGKTISK